MSQTIEERVNQALDKIRPAIQMDGGEVWLIRVEGDTAFVQMLGACGGCAMAGTTLKMGIEQIVTLEVPEITTVLAV
ncbi:MAG: NifU family protein [Candidatus Eremiobacteraeota bacterium]|nr:NifU family protein [Candidatus Eremiobacteraeota bacterium]